MSDLDYYLIDPEQLENAIAILQELIELAEKVSPPSEWEGWPNNEFFTEFMRIEDRARWVHYTLYGYYPVEGLDSFGFYCISSHSYIDLGSSSDPETLKKKRWIEQKKKFQDWLFGILDNLRLARTSQEDTPMTKTEIKLGDGTIIYGDLVVANSIKDSFNKATSADIPDELKELLIELAKEVAKMAEGLSNETAQQATRDLEVLTGEATSKTPRPQWIQLSVEGLKQAATNVGEIGKPVLELAAAIIPLLKP